MSASSPATASRKFDPALEGLRGLACMVVLFYHLSAGYVQRYFFPGIEAVLVFFLVSGYVIGCAYNTPYSPGAAREYGWRRFVRLWPLNLLAVVLSVAVFPVDGWGTIIANVFFLQNWETYTGFRIPPIKANWNLWSLNCEVVYYVAFLFLWRKRISSARLVQLIGVLALVSFTGWIFIAHQPKFISSYCFGAVFWCAGLWLAWYGKPLASTGDARGKLPWVSIGLLFLATVQYRLFFNVMDHFGYGWPKHSQLSFVNLQIFPLSFIILAGATSRIVPRIWWPLALLQPLAMVTYSAWSGDPHRFMFDDAGIGNLMSLLALILWPLKLSNRWLILLCPVGLISYGIYIFQAPAINFVELHWPPLMAEPLSFLVRFAVIVLLTLLIAYLMERILQPKIRRWLDAHLKPLLAAKPAEVPVATEV